jgi:SAM-dependent methyltransferase
MSGDALRCAQCGACYPVSAGVPVLLRPDNDVFSIESYLRRAPRAASSRSPLAKFVPSPSLNLSRDEALKAMRQALDRQGAGAILVVGGGRQRSWLTPTMQATTPHSLVYTDVDCGADVDIFCDAHDLPFEDGAFDAVVTTAVIEHVLYPEAVAEEIGRVLKLGGLLYSELPFMQQVHEGAYDFTRYTLSGHRRLFRHFMELRSGMVAGPATALVWAIENFFLAFVSGQRARWLTKIAARIAFSWMKYFDHVLVHKSQAMDGASCTYFFGSKTADSVSNAEIIRRYVGAKHLRHT